MSLLCSIINHSRKDFTAKLMLAVSAWDRLLVGDDCSMICRNAVPGRARGYVAGMSEEYRKKTL